jgi:hypothetical protein
MAKRKEWSELTKKEKTIGSSIFGAIVLIIMIAILGSGGSKQNTLAYTLVEEKDISIQNCKRVTYKIKVADGSDVEAVKATSQKLIDDNKSKWEDITVWTYKDSETDEFIKNNGYTVDMAEYSTCK